MPKPANPTNQPDYDHIILGSGIAGLYLALNLAPHGAIAILTKKHRAESNTNYAQGGIAAAISPTDTIQQHIQDTCQAGAGLCHPKVVQQILTQGPQHIQNLTQLGMTFSQRQNPKTGKTQWDLAQEGGHTNRRILHAKDITGRQIEQTLLHATAQHPNIHIYENHFAIDLITTQTLHPNQPNQPNQTQGIYALNTQTNQTIPFRAPNIIIATGGCGKAYLYTTNPDIATGDGVAIAYRAGAPILNMEFIQFHPTCLYHPQAKTFLISEAIRGEGATILNLQKKPIPIPHPLKSLAPRDTVARAIDQEMKQNGTDHVLLDITHQPAHHTINRFPHIYQTCLQYGINITKQPIPIVPAAHYQCGGIQTNTNGQTTIPGLYAIGEAACTGLHGANRLASNSLLEALVLAHNTAQHLKNNPQPKPTTQLPPWKQPQPKTTHEHILITHNWDELRRLMWNYVGILRTQKRLHLAQKRLQNLQTEIQDHYHNTPTNTDLLELRNLATVAHLIIQSALTRPESRGLHHNADHPNPHPQWAHRDTLLQKNQPPTHTPIPQ